MEHGFVRSPSGAFTPFDAPRAGTGFGQGTYAYSINNGGTIAGFYYDASTAQHAFVRTSSGVFTTFETPGARYTLANSINEQGDVTGGSLLGSNSGVHGFMRTHSGAATEFAAPGAGTQGNTTYTESINAAGTVTGWYQDEHPSFMPLCGRRRRQS